MAVIETDKKCFTFIWRLENASYCFHKKGECIESPMFVADEISKTTWNLCLYPRGEKDGNYIGCFLNREVDDKDEDVVEIKYELAIIGEPGSVLASVDIIHSFPKSGNSNFGCQKLVKREDVFILKRPSFLPNDTLTILCIIQKELGDLVENIRYFARTRIGVEKRSFLWKLEDFSDLEPEEECTFLIKSLEKGSELMSVNFLLSGGQNCDEIIRFKLIRYDQNIKYCALKLFLVDIDGNRVGCNQDEFLFDKRKDVQWFTFDFSRQMLMAKKSLYLPDDILCLQWEFAFSKGIVSEEIEEFQCGKIDPKSKFLMLTNQ